MRIQKAWVIAMKDFKSFRKRKSIIFSMVAFEGLVSVGLPLIIRYGGKTKGAIPASILPNLLNNFSFWFAIGAALIPIGIASYSIIGEKIQKSLEPLLATPTTDEEILVGKCLASLIPILFATYIGAILYMIVMNKLAYETLKYNFYPNSTIIIILLVLTPLISILGVGINIITSSKFNDVRSAQQFGVLLFVPFMAIYLLAEINIIPLTDQNLWYISGGVLIATIIASFIAKKTFQREEILTKWK